MQVLVAAEEAAAVAEVVDVRRMIDGTFTKIIAAGGRNIKV